MNPRDIQGKTLVSPPATPPLSWLKKYVFFFSPLEDHLHVVLAGGSVVTPQVGTLLNVDTDAQDEGSDTEGGEEFDDGGHHQEVPVIEELSIALPTRQAAPLAASSQLMMAGPQRMIPMPASS